jgi:hypothetical protein
MIEGKGFEFDVRRLYELSDDHHDVLTPLDLGNQLVSDIPSLDGSILVINNLEFLYILRERGIDMANVSYATVCEMKSAVAQKLGIDKSRIIRYNYDKLDEFPTKMKFDVIISNPPYQDGSGQGNNQKLWQLFAQLADNMVKEDGFVSYITPTSWKSPASRVNIVRSLFEENDLQWVTFDVSKYFGGVGSQFSAWMYQKRKNTGKTRIGNNIIDFSKSPYLPEGNNDIVGIHKKVIFDWEGDRLHISRHGLICSSKLKNQPDLVSEEKTNIHQYEYHHTNTKNLWGSKKGNDFDNPKVIFTMSGNAIPVIDYGYKGSSATSRYILAESIEDAKSYHSMMNSKLYQWILSTGKWGGFVNDGVLRMLPKLDTSKIWTNEEIYKHFNLTDEEIQLIEK